MTDDPNSADTMPCLGTGIGDDEMAILHKWAEDMAALGHPLVAVRLRWRAHCAFTGSDPNHDPDSNLLFRALEAIAGNCEAV